VRATVRAAGEMGIRYLTLFGFSSENWRRPAEEVGELTGLLRLYLRNELKGLHENGVRLKVIGERERFGEDLARMISDAEAKTSANTGLTLTIALSYGGRQEIVSAARRLAADAAAGRIDPEQIDESAFAARLFTPDIPDPDLLVRTSGEQRVSNFLLWQIAYAEMVFVETLWPDFGGPELEAAVRAFSAFCPRLSWCRSPLHVLGRALRCSMWRWRWSRFLWPMNGRQSCRRGIGHPAGLRALRRRPRRFSPFRSPWRRRR
jgi:undecaprenyl diphosphate synthase